MPPLHVVKASNDAFNPSYIPVVVVFGGTSGIGKAMTKRLAEQLQGRLRLVVVGRNKVAADKLFASLPKVPSTDSASGKDEPAYEFISCDLTLMSNAHAACSTLSSLCTKINYLVLASGQASFGPRVETPEGIDRLFALRFYWKFAVINDLLPLLRAAKGRGEQASVLTVLGKGNGPRIDFEDLGARKRYWYGIRPLFQGVSYGDLALSMFAERNPTIAFTHQFPGMVLTEANSPQAFSNPFWKFIAYIILLPLGYLFFIRVNVSAENMIYGLLQGEKGFYQRNTKGDMVGPRNVDYEEREKRMFWEHCVKETRSVPN